MLVWIVQRFLAQLEKRDETLREISVNCHATQERAAKAIDENTRIIGEVHGALEAHRQVIADAVRDGIDQSNCAKAA